MHQCSNVCASYQCPQDDMIISYWLYQYNFLQCFCQYKFLTSACLFFFVFCLLIWNTSLAIKIILIYYCFIHLFKGMYPSLPSISSIDFSMLREDQEWGLAFNYILQYPSILQDVRHEIMSNTGPKVNLQTHKVCHIHTCTDCSVVLRMVMRWEREDHFCHVC